LALLGGLGAGFGLGWWTRTEHEGDISPSNANRNATDSTCLTVEDMDANMAAWGAALVRIGDAWNAEGCAGALREADTALDTAYTFGGDNDGGLLFKPTLTVAPDTFRPTRAGALSYFVGECAGPASHVPTDRGFALGYSASDAADASTWQGFTHAYFHDMRYLAGSGAHCGAPVAQGKMTLTSRLTGRNGTVDKTFAFVRNPAPLGAGGEATSGGGKNVLRALIAVHHSSLQVES